MACIRGSPDDHHGCMEEHDHKALNIPDYGPFVGISSMKKNVLLKRNQEEEEEKMLMLPADAQARLKS